MKEAESTGNANKEKRDLNAREIVKSSSYCFRERSRNVIFRRNTQEAGYGWGLTQLEPTTDL